MAQTADLVVRIEPGVGAGAVRLGMPSAEVRTLMGEPESRHPDWLGVGETWYWHESTFQVAFGSDGTVGDIQLCASGPLTAVVDGIDVFWTPAEEVVQQLSHLGSGSYEEGGESFSFGERRLGFWRQSLPGEAPDDDEQYRGGRFWDTVNTWTTQYSAEIDAAAEATRKH